MSQPDGPSGPQPGSRPPATEGRRSSGVSLGTPFGVPLWLSSSWFIGAAIITWLFAPVAERWLLLEPPWTWVVAASFAVSARHVSGRARDGPCHRSSALWSQGQIDDDSPSRWGDADGCRDPASLGRLRHRRRRAAHVARGRWDCRGLAHLAAPTTRFSRSSHGNSLRRI